MADLLTRMGGMPALEELVDGLYDNMAADPDLGFFLQKNAQAIDFQHFMKVLKARTVDFCAASFGDALYNGPDLFNAHAFLSISMHQYDITMKCTTKKIRKMKMPKKVANEVLQEFEKMREPICDPQGKFRQWLFEKNKDMEAEDEEERVVGPMGFIVKASVLREMAEQKEKDEDRSRKMKERRLARETEMAAAAKAPKAQSATPKTKSAQVAKRASSAKRSARLVSAESAPAAVHRTDRLVSAESAPSSFMNAMRGTTPTVNKAERLESASTAGSGPGGVSWSSAFTRSSESAAHSPFHAPDEYRPGGVPSSRPTSFLRS